MSENAHTNFELLVAGAKQMTLDASSDCIHQLGRYLEVLARWNTRFNLTAITDPSEMVIKHLLDSLAIQPYIHGNRVADVGTGAGLPGIPLACLNPDKAFQLLDSAGKKTRFVTHAVAALRLHNVSVNTGRVQDYRPGTGFDTVVSRAFSSTQQFLSSSGHLCGPGGRMLAMKGAYPESELAEIASPWHVETVHRLKVPGLDAERHLVVCHLQE